MAFGPIQLPLHLACTNMYLTWYHLPWSFAKTHQACKSVFTHIGWGIWTFWRPKLLQNLVPTFQANLQNQLMQNLNHDLHFAALFVQQLLRRLCNPIHTVQLLNQFENVLFKFFQGKLRLPALDQQVLHCPGSIFLTISICPAPIQVILVGFPPTKNDWIVRLKSWMVLSEDGCTAEPSLSANWKTNHIWAWGKSC